MNELKQELVDDLSKKYLEKFFETTKENLLDKFYETADMYLYEHFSNVSDKIYEELCMSIITWSKEFYGKVWRKRKDLIDVIYKDNEEDILNKISLDRLHKLTSDILKNNQYHWSKDWDIQKCIIEMIKNNLWELDIIKNLIEEKLIQENERLKEEKDKMVESYNKLKNEICDLNSNYID